MAKRFGEREALLLLERLLGADRRASDAVELGIGDDAAIVRSGRERLIWTIDTQVEGVHFDRRWLSLEDVGWRSYQAAASDLAAMGARPLAALSSLILPRAFSRRELGALGRGQAAAARELRCPIAGGNLSRGGELSITTALLGASARPLLRAGARPGDEIWLIGAVGLARAGLFALASGIAKQNAALAECALAWRRPRALIARGLALSGRARAAIDVSDGLGGDLGQLATASEVRAIVEEARLVSALPGALMRAAQFLGEQPLALALTGGEDYALVATGPGARRPRFARRIGRIERGRGGVLERTGGRCSPLSRGFDHLR
jgi:thiamine-monophosphate kinase